MQASVAIGDQKNRPRAFEIRTFKNRPRVCESPG